MRLLTRQEMLCMLRKRICCRVFGRFGFLFFARSNVLYLVEWPFYLYYFLLLKIEFSLAATMKNAVAKHKFAKVANISPLPNPTITYQMLLIPNIA